MQIESLILFVVKVLDVVYVDETVKRWADHVVQIWVVLYLGDPALVDLFPLDDHAVNIVFKLNVWPFYQLIIMSLVFVFFDFSTFFLRSLIGLTNPSVFHLLLQRKLCVELIIKFG